MPSSVLESAEGRLELAATQFGLLKSPGGRLDVIHEILMKIKESTGFEAVGIRLEEDGDFPYYETSGFPGDFVEAERHLCLRDLDGQLLRDRIGKPLLECMCGNVIRGRTDPSLPFFSPSGSFWSNCTTELLATTTDEDRQARTRNRCNGEGYESVALVPLRSGDEIVGLLQLNDHKKGMFTEDVISFFEEVGSSIGIALARRQAEEALQRANVELEGFAHVVSHDLRGPLSAIKAAGEILESLLEKGDRSEIIELTATISRSIDKAFILIGDLLALAEAGQIPAQVSDVDISRVVEEVLEEHAAATSEKGVSFKVDTDLGSIRANTTQMYQLFSNLIGNAITHNDNPCPEITVRLLGTEGGRRHRYQVKDDGSGIPNEDLQKILLPFFKGKESGGTGIGLSIAKKIVEVYSGEIRAYNDDGAGFEFVVEDLDEH